MVKCGYCGHFHLLLEKGTPKCFHCEALNKIIDPIKGQEEIECHTYMEELEFKTKLDVLYMVEDCHCSGCEYSYTVYHNGRRWDGPGEGCGSCGDIDGGELYSDFHNKDITTEEFIRKWTLGNDQLLAYRDCGNFDDWFKEGYDADIKRRAEREIYPYR